MIGLLVENSNRISLVDQTRGIRVISAIRQDSQISFLGEAAFHAIPRITMRLRIRNDFAKIAFNVFAIENKLPICKGPPMGDNPDVPSIRSRQIRCVLREMELNGAQEMINESHPTMLHENKGDQLGERIFIKVSSHQNVRQERTSRKT
jgi:hypothetical protein